MPLEEVRNYGIVVAGKDGRVESFQEKPEPADARSTLASTGIYIFEPAALELIPSGQVYDIGSQLFPQLAEKGVSLEEAILRKLSRRQGSRTPSIFEGGPLRPGERAGALTCRCEQVLERCALLGWTVRTERDAWLLAREADAIRIADVYRAFVMQPGRDTDAVPPHPGLMAPAGQP